MPRKARPPRARSEPSAAELDREEAALARLAGDPTLISGVYNYCDRWCERCPLTARCLVFRTEQARRRRRGGGMGRDDADNARFWDDVQLSFALALRMATRKARELGIDLDAPDALHDAAVEERRRRRLAARQGSALHRRAFAYARAVESVIERLRSRFAELEQAWRTLARLEAGDPAAEATAVGDTLEVVQWYRFFIDVKLQRAVAGRVDEAIEGADGFPSDADGSVKVALIAVDRSLGAWAKLREHLPAAEDEILDVLVQLARLRAAVEREFPQARAFQRPGFD